MFRVWFLVTKLGWIPFALLALAYLGHAPVWVQAVLWCVIAALGFTGAGVALVALVWGLRMACPFCGRAGEVGGDKERGFWMRCEGCGVVEGRGRLSLGLKRELGGGPQS